MHAILQRLILDHSRLKILLEVLESQINDFHAEREHDLDLVCELVQYIKSYEDQVHHPTEDLIFGRFKTLTDKYTVILDTLEHQHRILAEMTKSFHHALEAVIQGDVIPRQGLENQGRIILQTLRDHVDLEEREVFTHIQESFASADWALLDMQVPKLDDPVFERPDPVRFRTLLRHLAQVKTG